METIQFIGNNLGAIGGLAVEHISIVAVAVGFAILTGVPIGISITQNRGVADAVLYVASIIVTIRQRDHPIARSSPEQHMPNPIKGIASVTICMKLSATSCVLPLAPSMLRIGDRRGYNMIALSVLVTII